VTKAKTSFVLGAADYKSSPAYQNAAVARCCDAWERAFEAEFEETDNEYTARSLARSAYRNAMPALSGHQAICDFIACVTHGMLIDAVQDKSATKLLYAAQVALSTVRQQPKSPEAPAA
jgi:hypothetical protein